MRQDIFVVQVYKTDRFTIEKTGAILVLYSVRTKCICDAVLNGHLGFRVHIIVGIVGDWDGRRGLVECRDGRLWLVGYLCPRCRNREGGASVRRRRCDGDGTNEGNSLNDTLGSGGR